VRLVGGEDHESVLIEDRAVGTDLSKKYVLTLTKDNRIEYRLVELGPEINGLRVVTRGLAPNELIVVNGLQHVRPGQSVAPTRVAMRDAAAGLSQVAAQPVPGPATPPPATSPVDGVSRLAQAAVALHVNR
jgi:multidrug efflux system membrane fusion protein